MLALLGALAIGLSLGLLGSGGSILTVPVLIYLVGQGDKVAIASSLGIVGAVSFAGFVPYATRGLVAWRTAALFGLPGMAGTYLGAYLSQYVSGTLQLVLFSFVMLAAAGLMIRGQQVSSGGANGSGVVRNPWKIGLDGLVVGVLTGLVGVGGGFLIVPALVLLGKLPMRLAVGTSLLIIAAKSASGFYKYLSVLESADLAIDWNIVATFSAIGAVGTFAGNALGSRVPQAALRRIFGVFLIVMAAFILWRELGATETPPTPPNTTSTNRGS